ncbi:hypothetical protein G3480_10200 [Thiorhodococcus mannitoliphagus]|uniref:DsrE family protein n=1 Tax=Thiorhodococcus mannitoliphagus TaxID=329406 RepID=A0A6P1DQZ1_9GAMM|nr:DsrE family protein [Thiorhodococcus mannitoliphagus]NEX20677.1 hypothetical protein [Thiorhodococcus mannitoliphagus]
MVRAHIRGFAAITLLTLLSATLVVDAQPPRRPWNDQPWELPKARGQSVAIALKTDPLEDPEAACVALQIGMNLMMSTLSVNGASVDVEPARDVTLFPTLGGVELVNPANDFSATDCMTQSGPMPLSDILAGYTGLGGRVLVCGLCAAARGITAPTDGAIGNAQQVHELFLYSDKVIDF